MNQKDINKLGKLAYHQCLYPLKKAPQSKHHLILGFDTEYDSKTRELLTIQISYRGKELYLECEPGYILTWKLLEELVINFLKSNNVPINKRHCRTIKLISYFSLAETQFIEDLSTAKVFETSIGTDFCYRGRNGRTLEVIDLMKFFNSPAQPLRKVAESFGYQKLDFDTSEVSRESLNDPLFKPYAMNDAHIAEGIFNDLRNQYITDFGIDILTTKTPASTSSSIFRKHYLDLKCEQPNTRLRKLGLLCAWGGRNESFRRGIFHGDIYEYDAFSEYPNSVVELGILPTHESWRPVYDDSDLQLRGISRVRFAFPESCEYPCLPVYSEPRLYYPLQGESYCTHAEIQHAIRLGAKITRIEGFCYSEGTSSLADYMKYFLTERQAAKKSGDKVRAHVIKLAINSLIGKFVQRVVKTDLNILNELSAKVEIPVHVLNRMDERSMRLLCEQYEIKYDDINKVSVGNSFYPEWNTLILGYARAATSEFISTLAERGYIPLICSTDSVIFEVPKGSEPPPENFHCNGIRFERRELGDKMTVLRTRLYRLQLKGETIKIAHHAVARRANAEKMFDAWEADQTQKIFHYPFTRLRTYREALTRNLEYGSEHHAPARRVGLGYDGKRELVENTFTKPLRVAG